ncbi:MAG: hypothetical protein ACF8QF_08630 [Phycisphaerales bacterium]
MSISWTTLALTPFGDDLHIACVRAGAGGVRIEETVVRAFHATPEIELKRLILAACPGGRPPSRTVFVCPFEWCAARPVALTTRQWPGARDEVLRSIDQMLPLTADDACIGLVDLHPDEERPGAPVGACLVGVRAKTMRRWTDPIERALGRSIDLALSPHMAALGLGLQQAPQASVLEPGPGAGAIRLRDGRIVGVTEPPGPGDRVALPGASEEGANSPGELAAAGAIAERVAPEGFRPLAGRVRSGAWKWATPGLAATLAAACLVGGFMIADTRRAEAIDTLRSDRAALRDRFEESRRIGERIERLNALLETGVAGATREWRSPLPVLQDVAGAIQRPAFLYRVDVSPRSVSLVGEADEVRAVLQRLEESDTLGNVALTDTVLPSPGDASLDVFSIRADRRRPEGTP